MAADTAITIIGADPTLDPTARNLRGPRRTEFLGGTGPKPPKEAQSDRESARTE